MVGEETPNEMDLGVFIFSRFLDSELDEEILVDRFFTYQRLGSKIYLIWWVMGRRDGLVNFLEVYPISLFWTRSAW